jgi:hypothetical protein
MVFLGKPDGKTPLGIPDIGEKINIQMDLRQIGWGGMD